MHRDLLVRTTNIIEFFGRAFVPIGSGASATLKLVVTSRRDGEEVSGGASLQL